MYNNGNYNNNYGGGYEAPYNTIRTRSDGQREVFKGKRGWVLMKKRSGAKLIQYTVRETGEMKEMITAWKASKVKGFLFLKAYRMTEKGAKKRAKALELSSEYTNVTSKGNERWVYEAEVRPNDSHKVTKYTGVAIFKRSQRKLYVPRFGYVASCNAPNGGYFGKSGKPKR